MVRPLRGVVKGVGGGVSWAAYCCDGASAPACACGKLFVAVNKFNTHVKEECVQIAL